MAQDLPVPDIGSALFTTGLWYQRLCRAVGGRRVSGQLSGALSAAPPEAATELRFEYAARLRDEINDLKRELREAG